MTDVQRSIAEAGELAIQAHAAALAWADASQSDVDRVTQAIP